VRFGRILHECPVVDSCKNTIRPLDFCARITAFDLGAVPGKSRRSLALPRKLWDAVIHSHWSSEIPSVRRRRPGQCIFAGSALRELPTAIFLPRIISRCRTAERHRAVSNQAHLPAQNDGHRISAAPTRMSRQARNETTSDISRLPKKKPGLVMLWRLKTTTNTPSIIIDRCPGIDTGLRRSLRAMGTQFANRAADRLATATRLPA
jgi:hypothetical protein